jgi:hypothetical protein
MNKETDTVNSFQDGTNKSVTLQNVSYVSLKKSSEMDVTQKSKIQDSRAGKKNAYLLTANVDSDRRRHSINTLTVAGFNVVLSLCEMLRDVEPVRVWSNKNTFMRVIKDYIESNSTDWLYIFEDDINMQPNTSIEDIEYNRPASILFTYLGICGPQTTPNGGKCGRCAHAMGFSYAGARDVLLFNHESKTRLISGNLPMNEPFFDVVVEGWCFLNGGFNVVHFEHTSPQNEGHKGLFFQNRDKFSSTIR